jgi:hypothetical protein
MHSLQQIASAKYLEVDEKGSRICFKIASHPQDTCTLHLSGTFLAV